MANPSDIRRQYHEHFEAAIAKLNPGQREAVDQIEGPVLVIAGPGTGKTHILSARIGRILIDTDTHARNILCLTFTDAGVNAMRERLLEFIGPEAHRVHIYTFHSFCNSIIQDNLELFGRHDLEPLTDLERVELIRRIIDELDHTHPLKQGRTDIYFYEKHLQDLFKQMKSEHWTVEYVHQQIDAYLEDLPNRKEFVYQVNRGENKKGDLKRSKIEDAQEKMERLRAAADLFPAYQKAMEKARRYDYDDMILWVLKAFEENENLLRNYQEQYLYFLVDEYQDTNGAQNEIIQKLLAYWSSPNIFIVGDDDQSIYEFQGARLKNLTDFYFQYKEDVRLVMLQENYRSSQSILDTSRTLIDHNEKRIVNSLKELAIEKILQAQHEEYALSSTRPRIVAYANRAQEEADIVRQIEQLHKSGFPLEEVAIIYARHRQARNIITLLEKKGIPYNTRRKVNILDLPLIRNIRTILEYLSLEIQQSYNGDYLLFRILHFPFLGISPDDLATISLYLAKMDWKDRPKWRDIIKEKQLPDGLQLKNKEAVIKASQLIEDLLSRFTAYSVPAFIERITNRSGVLKYILSHPEKVWLIQVLKTFFDFVQQESDRNPRISIRRLLDIIDRMDDNRLPVEVNKTIVAGDGVNLLTAHSSKGLEFQRVFIIDCVKENWEPRSRGSNYRFSLPDTLTFSGEEDALEARRRLFYVAMTRTKEHLRITYSDRDQNEKELQRAIFVDELTINNPSLVEEAKVDQEVLLEAQLLQMMETEKPVLPKLDKAVIDSLLENFTLSVSSMNRYLSCPLGFYYENVLKVPVLIREAALYGTAMHNALQRLFERMLMSKHKQFPNERSFLQLFEGEMKKQRSGFSRKEYERRMETGSYYLTDFYRNNLKNWNKKVKVEYTIRNVEVEGVPITGSIDKLEFLDKNKARIIDYKTGSQSSSKVRRSTEKNPEGGNYWRQLVFYKILYESSGPLAQEVTSGVIQYIEPNARGEFTERNINYRPKDVKEVKELIITTYHKIRKHEFYEGCGEKNCSWCNFIKNNIVPESFSDQELEELDD